MKKIIVLLFFTLFSLAQNQSQKIFATKINQISVDADQFFGYDQFGFYYTAKNNLLFKTKDNFSLEYKNISLGEITHVDRQNPLKIVLFYENFNSIVLLDNQLNESQKINFSDNEAAILATAAGIASQNRLWVYNNLTQQIGFFDYLKNSFQSITPPFEGKIKYYESDFTTFQWVDAQSNWYSCDVFGKISSLGKIPDFDYLQFVSNQTVLFSKEGLFYFYDVEKSKTYSIENLEKSSTNFYYKDQILSIFTNREISNFKIQLP
ncbi:MAG: hypothetical protein K9I26_05200 [Flavobacterium sp.]|nr:hypothetical protein [Flavobacterium sp.]